ncbi:MAG: AI-2E family transporter [Gammaproteobacteria bacterium]
MRITHWLKQQVANPQVVFLALVLIGAFLTILYAGSMLAPVLAGIVIAYLLEGLTRKLTRLKMPRAIAVWLVFLAFMLFVVMVVFVLLPTLYNQLTQMVQQIPSMLTRGQAALMTLPEKYPELFSVEQVGEIISGMRAQLTAIGQSIVASSLSGAAGAIGMLIYLILLPILIFFFLRDQERILNWFLELLPRDNARDNELVMRVWGDVDAQIGNYIRGKFWEILIVWLVTFVCFTWFGLQFAMLLSVLVGLSVLIPYVGAAVVTIPVVLIAWFQWGWSGEFAYVVAAYLVIQALDGNLLAPLLFAEVVNIHPVAIIVAVLFFGGLWGLWGVFFAIPLATLVQAVIVAWPKSQAAAERE